MVQEILIDGIYRPEKWIAGQWTAVAYVNCRGRVNRCTYSTVQRGRTFEAYYPTEIEAQKVCDQLNNTPQSELQIKFYTGGSSVRERMAQFKI